MAYSVAYQHTDGYRNHDGSYKLHGIKKVGTDRNLLVPYSIYVTTARLCNTVLNPCDFGYIMNHFIQSVFHPGNKKRTQSSRLDAQPKNKFNH